VTGPEQTDELIERAVAAGQELGGLLGELDAGGSGADLDALALERVDKRLAPAAEAHPRAAVEDVLARIAELEPEQVAGLRGEAARRAVAWAVWEGGTEDYLDDAGAAVRLGVALTLADLVAPKVRWFDFLFAALREGEPAEPGS
jgi:hypothetical protein